MLMNAPKSRESDIYAFGMTIVEVITGKVPFPDIISPGAIAMAITSGQRPTLEPLSRDQTSFGDLWMLASSCWDHNPDKRPSAKDSLNKMTASAGYGRPAGLLDLPPSHEVLGLSASVASKSGTKSLTEKPVSFGRPKLTARAMSTPVSMISYAMAHSTLAEDRNLSSTNIHDEQTSQTSTGTSSRRSSMISYATDGSASVNSPMDGHNGASFQTMARSLSRPSSVRCHATEQSLVNDQKSSLTDVQGNTLKILAETPTLLESLLDTRSVSPSGREVVEDDVFGDKTGSDLVLQQSIAGRFYYTFTSDSDPVIPQGTSKGKGESTTPPNLPDSLVDHTSPPNSRTLEWLVNHQPISSKTPTPTKETLPLSPSPVFPKHELEVSSDSYSSSSSFGLSLSSTPGVYESSPSIPEPDMLSIPEERSLNEVADCSSCGVFLDVFRYVCSTCGPRRTMRRSSYKRREIQESADGYDSRDDTHKNEGPSRLPSLLRVFGDTERSKDAPDRGYELCLDCMYTAGLSHALQGNIGHNPPIVDEPPPYHLMSSRILESGGPISASSSSKQADVGHHLRAPVQNVGPRHAYIESMWDSRNGWEVIRQEDKKECSTCRGPLASSRYKCFSCSDFDLCVDCYSQVHEIHPAHVFLAILRERKDNISSLSIQLKLPDGPVLRHENFHCHFCQEDIIGARFHCAVCRSVDVCQNCDLAGLAGLDDDSDQDGHNSSHIMIKIQYPLKSKDVEAASRQAFEIWSGSGSVVTPTSKSLIMSRTRTNSVDSAYAATVIAAATNSLTEKGGPRSDHLLRCNECFNPILGIRYQCANCPSDPTAYNLCENCEKMSFAFHHFPHVFIKFNRRVDRPIKSKDPLIPVLWKEPRRILDNDVQELDHMKTLCDRCMTHIRGVWYHCAICHADMCSIHEKTHDASHCFLVFKTQVRWPVSRSFRVADALDS
ncbi:hypothetical protein FRB93_005229 [Tulasnella sp. JGI-2019a]|nr:hypothetical protein FRB93_005229 [Tulasnella sp. JGI-2019a]